MFHYSQVYINRDFLETLKGANSLEAVLVWGARQVGKTTLLDQLSPKSRLLLDDLGLRQRAQSDPALVLDAAALPCLIDEAQYAPNLFPEIKLRIDRLRREKLRAGRKSDSTQYYLTGSNRLLLDKGVKESLAGRCHIYVLHGLSVREILAQFPDLSVASILLRGGFPLLYTHPDLVASHYLNDYILSFVEKDVAFSAGVEKLPEFETVLRLLAARTGQFLNLNEIGGAAGVDQKTVQSWIDTLSRNAILELVPPFVSNLSKRILKMKKLYFYDVGLCARLQGHSEEQPLWNSPQAGSLFETLVFSEIVKTKDNFLKEWQLYCWRTKEQQEIDFILKTPEQIYFLEAKLGIHGARPFSLDSEARKVFPGVHQKIVVTAGGDLHPLDRETSCVPIAQLGNFLLNRTKVRRAGSDP